MRSNRGSPLAPSAPIARDVRVVVPGWLGVSLSDVFSTGRTAIRQPLVVRAARHLVADPVRARALAFSPPPL